MRNWAIGALRHDAGPRALADGLGPRPLRGPRMIPAAAPYGWMIPGRVAAATAVGSTERLPGQRASGTTDSRTAGQQLIATTGQERRPWFRSRGARQLPAPSGEGQAERRGPMRAGREFRRWRPGNIGEAAAQLRRVPGPADRHARPPDGHRHGHPAGALRTAPGCRGPGHHLAGPAGSPAPNRDLPDRGRRGPLIPRRRADLGIRAAGPGAGRQRAAEQHHRMGLARGSRASSTTILVSLPSSPPSPVSARPRGPAR